MKKMLLLAGVLMLTGCTQTFEDAPIPVLTTTTGLKFELGQDVKVSNYTGADQKVCVNTTCTTVLSNETWTAAINEYAVSSLSGYGMRLDYKELGAFVKPTSRASITTDRIAVISGKYYEVGDNIPGQGEQWSQRPGQIKVLIVEHIQ